jgi:hypothetical protein
MRLPAPAYRQAGVGREFGLRPSAQAPPHRGFCPGGRALWLGEIAEFGSRSGVGPKQIIGFISQCLQKRGYFFGLEH